MATGKIIQIIGPVIDAQFPSDQLPRINDAVSVKTKDSEIIMEVEQYLGDGVVRCIAMSSTDGLSRGLPVIDKKEPISVPVGPGTLGRVFNILGEPIYKK